MAESGVSMEALVATMMREFHRKDEELATLRREKEEELATLRREKEEELAALRREMEEELVALVEAERVGRASERGARVVPTGTHRRTEEDKFQELGLKWRDTKQRILDDYRAGKIRRKPGKKHRNGKRSPDHFPGTTKLKSGRWQSVPRTLRFNREIEAYIHFRKMEFLEEEVVEEMKVRGLTEWEDAEAEPFDPDADEEAEEDDEPYFTVEINGKNAMVMTADVEADPDTLKAGSVYELLDEEDGSMVPGKKIGTWKEGKFVPLPKKPTIVVGGRAGGGGAGGGGAGGGGARTPVNP